MIDLHYWTDAERPQDHDVPRGGRPAVQDLPGQHRQGRAVQARLPRIAPNNRMPAIVDHEPRRRRRADLGVRIGRDPALSRREDRALHADGSARPRRGACSGCSGRWAGSGRWPGRTTTSRNYAPEKLPYAIDRYVNETNRLYGVLEQAARRPRLRRRRVLDRRHGLLSVDRAVRAAGPEPRRLPAPEALVRGHRGAAGHGARLRGRRVNPRGARHRTEEAQEILFGQTAASMRRLSGALLGGRAPDRLYPIDELGLWRLT